MYRKNQVLGRFCPAQHPDSRFILFCNCLIFSIMQSENSLKLCSPLRYRRFLCHINKYYAHASRKARPVPYLAKLIINSDIER